jgi:hypothetical protein
MDTLFVVSVVRRLRSDFNIIGGWLKMIEDIFEEIETDQYSVRWSSVCDECIETHKIDKCFFDDAGSAYCMVKGCNNEAEYYVEFDSK